MDESERGTNMVRTRLAFLGGLALAFGLGAGVLAQDVLIRGPVREVSDRDDAGLTGSRRGRPAHLKPGLSVEVSLPLAIEKLARDFFLAGNSKPVGKRTATAVAVGYTRIARRGIPSETQLFFGQLRPAVPLLPDDRTIFMAGSISKLFPATLLAFEVLRGERSYDEKLVDLIPAMPIDPVKNQITLLHLATHTSSLPKKTTNDPPTGSDPFLYTFEDLFDNFETIDRQPGKDLSDYFYSNMAFSLLGRALDKEGEVLINRYEFQFEDFFGKPLGMDDTAFLATDLARLAQTDGVALDRGFGGGTTLSGGGNYRTTLHDLMSFLQWNMGRKAFSLPDVDDAAVAAEVRRVRANAKNNFEKMGLGWNITFSKATSEFRLPQGAKATIWKTGSAPGFSTYIGHVSGTSHGVVVLVAGTDSPKQLGIDILATLEAYDADFGPTGK